MTRYNSLVSEILEANSITSPEKAIKVTPENTRLWDVEYIWYDQYNKVVKSYCCNSEECVDLSNIEYAASAVPQVRLKSLLTNLEECGVYC